MKLLLASLSIVPMCSFTIPNSQYVYTVTLLTLYIQFHLHGADYSILHEFLPREHLPLEFGGLLPPLDEYSAAKLFEGELVSS